MVETLSWIADLDGGDNMGKAPGIPSYLLTRMNMKCIASDRNLFPVTIPYLIGEHQSYSKKGK